MIEREKFELWMKKRGTILELEHHQAFDAWMAAKTQAREECDELMRVAGMKTDDDDFWDKDGLGSAMSDLGVI